MNAVVSRFGKKSVKVKDLGWLLRNHREVAAFYFEYLPLDGVDGKLVAKLNCGGTFLTIFTSVYVCARWLDRPMFRGLPLTLRRRATADSILIIGDENYKGAFSHWVKFAKTALTR